MAFPTQVHVSTNENNRREISMKKNGSLPAITKEKKLRDNNVP